MPKTDLAVLTGDIIASSRLAPEALDGALARLASAAAVIAGWDGGQQVHFSRFRGDGWQCLAPSPALALRSALFLRANLRALDRLIDSRMSVGIGPGLVPTGSDLAATGPAFEISGRGLDRMGRAQHFAIGWSSPPEAAAVIAAVFALSDAISRLWTPRQAQVFARTLTPGTEPQVVLAEALGVSQQSIAKHLQAGGDWALRRALAALEGMPDHDGPQP